MPIHFAFRKKDSLCYIICSIYKLVRPTHMPCAEAQGHRSMTCSCPHDQDIPDMAVSAHLIILVWVFVYIVSVGEE